MARYWRVWNDYSLWFTVFVFLLFVNIALTQVYEGSAGDSGPTREIRFVESSNDEVVISANAERTCLKKQFSGNGFRLKGVQYEHLYICPNGMIRFRNEFYQNWPYNYGTFPLQRQDPSLSPFWARVDLSAFGTSSSDSKVRFANYHNNTNRRQVVFDKVNEDVSRFTQPNFEATWVSVVTFENIRPHDRVQRGYLGKNTFQVVFASNETSWYLIYNYADIDWAVGVPRSEYGDHVDQAGLPVAGWNAGERNLNYRENEEYQNLPGSGTIFVEDIDDVVGTLDMPGRWIFSTSPPIDKPSSVQCYEWIASTPPVLPNRRQCPRFERQAFFDRRFRRQDKYGRICYARIFPRRGRGLRCCFRRIRGPLLANLPEPGGFLSRNPLFDDDDEEDRAYENCCIFSDLCSGFFQHRPKQNGRSYRPPRAAVAYGDPHYANLDRYSYTYNGCGDFMFVISEDERFQIQVRFSVAEGAGLGTVISAILLKIEGVETIQINHNGNDNPPLLLLVNNTIYPEYDSLSEGATLINEDVTISKVGDNVLEIVTSDDHSIVVTHEPNNLVVVVSLDFSLFGLTKGLLGNWSERTDDDFMLPNGTLLNFPPSEDEIHNIFGESWRLTQDQNLIVNTTADKDFTCPAVYMPTFLNNFTFPNSSIQQMAISICGNNINCQFDVAATLLPSFGQNTIDSFTQFEEERNITENNVPTFENADVVFNLTLGELFMYSISAEDIDGDVLEIQQLDLLPPGATVQTNGTSITFRWLVNSTRPFNLSFLVQDSKNASSLLIPIVTVCACQNNGVCVQPATTVELQNLTFSRHSVLSCECSTTFTGEFCEMERDFCQPLSGRYCHPLTNCSNSQGGTCGDCPSGYRGDGQDCADIDECAEGTHDCEMLCRNNAGSFVCECMTGYRLDENMKNCSDINECETAHDCQQNCTNIPGSFTCSCFKDFNVDLINSEVCIPISSCSSGNNCEQVCAVNIDTNEAECSCNRGYVISPEDPTQCVDDNECDGSNNLCNQLCENSPGSFKCSCINGYDFVFDNFTCIDKDECVMSIPCDANDGLVCINLPGSFKCECNEQQGFVLINGVCQIPEDGQVVIVEPKKPPTATKDQMDNSVELRLRNVQNDTYDRSLDTAFRQSIANALNSYCNANEQRRTECLLPGHGFEFSESNIFRVSGGTVEDNDDLLVSYYGTYPVGIFDGGTPSVPRSVLLNALNQSLDAIFVSTGVPLEISDVDECNLGTDGCNQFCFNIAGSFVCSCLPGYRLHRNMTTCIDIDECAEQTHNCNETGTGEICRNTLHTFVCECNSTLGYGLINGVCQDLNGAPEALPESRNATTNQTNSAVELTIPNFQANQYSKLTDQRLRSAIANALNTYCHADDTRRAECGLPGSGFEFSEQNIHRIPTDPNQDGSDTSVSFYALYPNGILDGTDIPVPQQVLSNAIRDDLINIRNSTGLDSLSLAEDDDEDESVDLPLILGLSLAGALILSMGIAVFCCCYCGGIEAVSKKRRRRHPMRYVYDAYRHRPRRRLNVADLEPSFGTFHSMSGETYSGFDEDGLPVDIQTDYDGLSRQARTVTNVPTASGSRLDYDGSHSQLSRSIS